MFISLVWFMPKTGIGKLKPFVSWLECQSEQFQGFWPFHFQIHWRSWTDFGLWCFANFFFMLTPQTWSSKVAWPHQSGILLTNLDRAIDLLPWHDCKTASPDPRVQWNPMAKSGYQPPVPQKHGILTLSLRHWFCLHCYLLNFGVIISNEVARW